MTKSTDIRVLEIQLATQQIDYRTPMKFGGRVVADVIVADATVRVVDRQGRGATGRGSMTMGNAWAWPSTTVASDRTLAGMTSLFERLGESFVGDPAGDCDEFGDPLELGHRLNRVAATQSRLLEREEAWGEPMPVLAQRVVASPIDAAIHDAFGRLLGASSFGCLGRELINHDLSHHLDTSFQGEYLDQYISAKAVDVLPLYHLVGALDPLTPEDLEASGVAPQDGLPLLLDDWIRADGLDHLKIKLAGDDLEWDVARVLSIDHLAEAVWLEQGKSPGVYSLDFNERCADVAYVLEFLDQVRSARPQAFDRVQYIEQPTHRDLKGRGAIDMRRAAEVKPVVIDESLLDLESLYDARSLGYSGIALKACKGQTDSLLMAAAARKFGMFLCVQDLTCVGASFLHSASLAAHVPGVAAIEGNGRQYCPRGNQGWDAMYPGMFQIDHGRVHTNSVDGWGLGFEWLGATPGA
ncbi:MAG: mandelate racemase/muconate lactonizing enzyme family protein [Planctomycetales bacterium]|nr:mandelate racemase/muconate lactonizing enzyme family protein [Planctomycetales bacterium]